MRDTLRGGKSREFPHKSNVIMDAADFDNHVVLPKSHPHALCLKNVLASQDLGSAHTLYLTVFASALCSTL